MTVSSAHVISHPDVVIGTDVTPNHWTFYIQGSGGSHLLLWHQIWFYAQGAYCLARMPGCYTHAVLNGLLVIQ